MLSARDLTRERASAISSTRDSFRCDFRNCARSRSSLRSPPHEGIGRRMLVKDLSRECWTRPKDRTFCQTCYARPFTVKVIAHPDNSTSFEVIESQLENPLIDADHQDLLAMKQLPIPGGHHHRSHHKRNHTDDLERKSFLPDK